MTVESETKARCLWLSQERLLMKDLNRTGFYVTAFVLVLQCRNFLPVYCLQMSRKRYFKRHGDSCRNLSVLNFNACFSYPHKSHWRNARKAGKWVNIQEMLLLSINQHT